MKILTVKAILVSRQSTSNLLPWTAATSPDARFNPDPQATIASTHRLHMGKKPDVNAKDAAKFLKDFAARRGQGSTPQGQIFSQGSGLLVQGLPIGP